MDFLFVKFDKPVKRLYTAKDDCPPKERGDGCCYDCSDCYHRDVESYERYAAHEKQLRRKNRNSQVVF